MDQFFSVLSPVSGVCVPLSQVPDPVFSKKMLGDGLAVDPVEGLIVAPLEGTITNFNKNLHAFVIEYSGLEILVHVGLDTVHLKGKGFTPLVRVGDEVTAGQPVLKFDLKTINMNLVCPFVLCVVTAPTHSVVQALPVQMVQAGQTLFTVQIPASEEGSIPALCGVQSAPITIVNPHGLHARPAGKLVHLTSQYAYPVWICKGARRASAKSITGILGLALVQGDQITLRIEGPQEEAQQLLAHLQRGFETDFNDVGGN